jgi:hypothetical protein
MKTHWLAALVLASGVFAGNALAQFQEPREPQFPRDLHGLWWQPIDPGWATVVFDHYSAMSAATLVYEFDGSPTWYFASRLECVREGAAGLNANCFGPIAKVTGPWFGDATYRSDLVRSEVVGQWEGWWGTPLFASVGPNNGRPLFQTYTINNWQVRAVADQPLRILVIDPEFPLLYYNTGQSGLWGTRGENGWGIGLFQQGQKLTATLMVHDRDRQPRWYVMHMKAPDLVYDFDRPYEGEVYATRGHFFGFNTLDPYSARQVGRASVRFLSEDSQGPAELRYSIDGVQVTKTIYRVPDAR